jgi:hypothetical protein
MYTRFIRVAIALVTAACACTGEKGPQGGAQPAPSPAASSATPTAARRAAAPPVAAASATGAVSAAPPERPFPDLSSLEVMTLAREPGGTVKLTLDGGGEAALADGIVLTLSAAPDGVSPPDPHARHVTAGDKRGFVPGDEVINDIARAPTGGFAVATGILECGDMCHSAVWLLRGYAQRWRLFPTSVRAAVAWHPTGTSVVVGGDTEIVMIELPSGKISRRTTGYLAPAFAPDGTLYVRNGDYDVLVLEGDRAKKVGQGKRRPSAPGVYETGPHPVDFPTGKWELPAGER